MVNRREVAQRRARNERIVKASLLVRRLGIFHQALLRGDHPELWVRVLRGAPGEPPCGTFLMHELFYARERAQTRLNRLLDKIIE